jgi:hypothetical protein
MDRDKMCNLYRGASIDVSCCTSDTHITSATNPEINHEKVQTTILKKESTKQKTKYRATRNPTKNLG